MIFDTFDQLNTAFELAQAKWLQGDIFGAYDSLQEIFRYRLLHAKFIDADLKVIQLLADLAGILGEFKAADYLLYSAISLYKNAKSISWADYTRLKRIQLNLDSGKLNLARNLLKEMAPSIGDFETIQFTSSGLLQWESNCFWQNTDHKDRTVLFAEIYLAMGRLLIALGAYGEALAALHQGLAHAKGIEVSSLGRQTILPLNLAIATAYLEQGNFNNVDTCISDIQVQLLKEPQHLQYKTWCLELSGKLNLLRGNLGDGLKQFQEVQQICCQFRYSKATIRSTLNLAHILILLNQTATAQDYLVGIQKSFVKDAALASRAELLINLARARSLTIDTPIANPKKNSEILEKLTVTKDDLKLDLSTQSSNYLTRFENLALAFQWRLSDQDMDLASKLIKHIRDVFNNTDSYLIKLQIRVLEATFLYYQWKKSTNITSLQLANKILEEICPQLNEMGLIPELWQAQRILCWCRTRLIELEKYTAKEIQDLTVSTNNLLKQMTDSLTLEDKVFYLLNKWTSDEDYIAKQIDQLRKIKSRLSKNPFKSLLLSRNFRRLKIRYLNPLMVWNRKMGVVKLTKLRHGNKTLFKNPFWINPWHYLQLMRQLNALVEHIDRYKDTLAKRNIQKMKIEVPHLPVASFWWHLLTHPQDRVTISFLILPDRVLVVIIGRFLFDFHVISTTRVEVRNQVQRWYKPIENSKNERQKSKRMQSVRDFKLPGEDDQDRDPIDPKWLGEDTKNAGQKVVATLAETLGIPQILENLPKHIRALTIIPDDILHGFPFAAIVYKEKYLVEHYAISIAYETKPRRSPTNSMTSPQKALIVGVSNGNTLFPELSGVRPEIKRVESWLNDNQMDRVTLINPAKATVMANLSQATLFHIACHGTFELDQPDKSGLAFIDDSGKHEILTLRELSEMDLRNLRHVTLSACHMADHFILPGRWIISLPETLWRSGTQSILGCLWEVNDEVAKSFMNCFYKYLDKFPRDEALRKTQLDCLNNCLPNCSKYTANPFLWAGFNLYGDYNSI